MGTSSEESLAKRMQEIKIIAGQATFSEMLLKEM